MESADALRFQLFTDGKSGKTGTVHGKDIPNQGGFIRLNGKTTVRAFAVPKGAGAVEKAFDKSYGRHFDVKCKFGIYKIDFIGGDTLESSLNFAKLSSDFIKNDESRNIVEYSSDIARQIQLRTYVVDNLDEALDQGWIQV